MHEALKAIEAIVGPRGLVDAEAAEGLLTDHLGRFTGRPALIVRPASTAEVGRVLAACNDARIGVVPQGGNTGYCGGATPDASGRQVLLCLSRMNAVREVDAGNFTMTVDAGVTLAAVRERADEAGMHFPLSLGSEGSCHIGGNLATNAGGTAVLKFGNARDLALGLEVVLADGTVLDRLSALRKDNAGYDLNNLFIGSEGTLGVITAAVLKLYPRPAARETAFVAVASREAAVRLLMRARRTSGDMVTSFEFIPRLALDLVLRHIDRANDPLGEPYEHYVLVELSSSAALRLDEMLERLLGDAMEAGEVLDAAIAGSGAQRDALWRIRENIPEAQTRAGGSLKHDVSVPTSRIDRFMRESGEALSRLVPGARLCAYGHLGDGNLHYNLLPPAGRTLAEFRAEHGEAVSALVHERILGLGGSVAAEHGVGQAKAGLLAATGDPAALALMANLKAALDPRGILNPGKVLAASVEETGPA